MPNWRKSGVSHRAFTLGEGLGGLLHPHAGHPDHHDAEDDRERDGHAQPDAPEEGEPVSVMPECLERHAVAPQAPPTDQECDGEEDRRQEQIHCEVTQDECEHSTSCRFFTVHLPKRQERRNS